MPICAVLYFCFSKHHSFASPHVVGANFFLNTGVWNSDAQISGRQIQTFFKHSVKNLFKDFRLEIRFFLQPMRQKSIHVINISMYFFHRTIYQLTIHRLFAQSAFYKKWD